MKYFVGCLVVAVSLTVSVEPASARNCREIQFRLWQDGENRFFDHGETATLDLGTDADIYLHVTSRTKGHPYSTASEFSAPTGRSLGYRRQNSDDLARGRLKVSGRSEGTAQVGFKLTGVKSPGRLENVPSDCRSGHVTVRVVDNEPPPPPPPPPSPPSRPQPPAPAESDPIALCQEEIQRQIELEHGIGKGVELFAGGYFEGRRESFHRDDPSLRDNRVGNDHASSVRVPPSCDVVLYADHHYRGESTYLDHDVASLAETRVGNDRVSSLQVNCDESELAFQAGARVFDVSRNERGVIGEVFFRLAREWRSLEYSCTVDIVAGRVNEADYRQSD